MDHFHPQAAGGSDDLENLVYACTACNRFKGDYTAAPDAPDSLRLLHPQRDNLGAHIEETVHGRLLGITPRGWFHIRRLHLNRAQLVELRRLQHVLQSQKDDLSRAREAEARLKQENSALQGEITRLRAAIAELLRGRER
jgi:HNH endonuclease